MPRVLWDFETQTDHQISTRKPDQMIIAKKKERKKKTCHSNKLQSENQIKKNEISILTLPENLKNCGTRKSVDDIVIGALGTVCKSLGRELEGLQFR